MVGYKYDTEEEAIIARKDCADYKGLPINEGDETIYWVDFNYSELDLFWYICCYEGLEVVLGEPYEFNVTETFP
tara:strand:- start:154 stop:375 length:222 start_codon:yes stop_codon:yes gene_type:complete